MSVPMWRLRWVRRGRDGNLAFGQWLLATTLALAEQVAVLLRSGNGVEVRRWP